MRFVSGLGRTPFRARRSFLAPRWLLALALGLSAVVARPLATTLLGSDLTFQLAFVAVVVAAWYGGFGPAILTAGVSLVGSLSLVTTGWLTGQGLSGRALLFAGLSAGVAHMGERVRRRHRQLKSQMLDAREQAATALELAALRTTLHEAIESFEDGFALFDADDKLVLCNEGYARYFTRSGKPDEVIGLTFEQLARRSVEGGEVIDPAFGGDIDAWIAHRVSQHRNPGPHPQELQIGRDRWLQVLERRTAQGGIVCIRRDVSERKTIEQREVMEHAVTAILARTTSIESVMPEVIQAVCRSMGWDCGAWWQWNATTKTLECAQVWSDPDDHIELFLRTSRAQHFAPSEQGLIRRVWMTAEPLWLEDLAREPGFQRAYIAGAADLCSALAFPVLTAEDEPRGVLEFYSRVKRAPDPGTLDVTRAIGQQLGQTISRLEAQRAVRQMAHYDALTALPNRHLLEELTSAAIDNGKPGTICLLYLDLDGFKEVNDRLGHATGDRVLVKVANRLRESLRITDALTRAPASAARVGGDEFIVLLQDVDHTSDVDRIVTRLLSSLSRPYDVGDAQVTLTASIGIAMYPQHGRNLASLMSTADHAMYAAKQAGRNRAQTAA